MSDGTGLLWMVTFGLNQNNYKDSQSVSAMDFGLQINYNGNLIFILKKMGR